MRRTIRHLALANALVLAVSLVSGQEPDVPHVVFLRGDVNADAGVDIGDPIALLGALFQGAGGPSCRDAADSNDDGSVDVSDAVFALLFLFNAGAPLPEPSGDCGIDPTDDALRCLEFPLCSQPAIPFEVVTDPDGERLAIVEGDLVLGSADELLQGDGGGAAARVGTAWPCGRIPYVFHESVPDALRQTILGGIERWETPLEGHVDFVPHTIECNFVLFRQGDPDGEGGYVDSFGMASGANRVTIHGMSTMTDVAHEVGHVLGLAHEHNRPDRDEFIEIDWDAWERLAYLLGGGNFTIAPADLLTPYDLTLRLLPSGQPRDHLGSIMHYGSDQFSVGRTLFWARGDFEVETARLIQQSPAPTARDVSGVEAIYPLVGAPPVLTLAALGGETPLQVGFGETIEMTLGSTACSCAVTLTTGYGELSVPLLGSASLFPLDEGTWRLEYAGDLGPEAREPVTVRYTAPEWGPHGQCFLRDGVTASADGVTTEVELLVRPAELRLRGVTSSVETGVRDDESTFETIMSSSITEWNTDTGALDAVVSFRSSFEDREFEVKDGVVICDGLGELEGEALARHPGNSFEVDYGSDPPLYTGIGFLDLELPGVYFCTDEEGAESTVDALDTFDTVWFAAFEPEAMSADGCRCTGSLSLSDPSSVFSMSWELEVIPPGE